MLCSSRNNYKEVCIWNILNCCSFRNYMIIYKNINFCTFYSYPDIYWVTGVPELVKGKYLWSFILSSIYWSFIDSWWRVQGSYKILQKKKFSMIGLSPVIDVNNIKRARYTLQITQDVGYSQKVLLETWLTQFGK